MDDDDDDDDDDDEASSNNNKDIHKTNNKENCNDEINKNST